MSGDRQDKESFFHLRNRGEHEKKDEREKLFNPVVPIGLMGSERREEWKKGMSLKNQKENRKRGKKEEGGKK